MSEVFQRYTFTLALLLPPALLDATSAVISGASLTLACIGRHLPGMASVKHKIKRADRLLGNVHLHGECSTLFQRTTRYLTRNMPHVFGVVTTQPSFTSCVPALSVTAAHCH